MVKQRLVQVIILVVMIFVFALMACSSNPEKSNTVGNKGNSQVDSVKLEADSKSKEDDKMEYNVNKNMNVNVYEKAKMIGKAVNLGNALEAPYEGAWDVVIEEEYFQLIKEKGFDSVRVPIRFSNKTTQDSPYTVEDTFMKRVDWVVEQSLKQGLNVIIDLHHFDEMLADPSANKERFLSIWQQIASRYSSQPENVYYEILNEPNGLITAHLWNEYLLEAVELIREYDPHRTLIIGGVDWNGIDGLYKLNLPEEDRNIIATFHYYGPMLFTHQGAEWMTAEYGTTGLVWPGPPETAVEPNEAAKQIDWVRNFFNDYNTKTSSDNPASKEAIIRDLERAVKWGETNDRPLFLGEFGAYRTADLASRVAWTKTVRLEAERLGISWAYWEFGAGYGIYDRSAGKWKEELIEALFSSQ